MYKDALVIFLFEMNFLFFKFLYRLFVLSSTFDFGKIVSFSCFCYLKEHSLVLLF